MTAGHLWHLWRARNWPALGYEELTFVSDLRDLSGGVKKDPDRGDYSLVLNALRSGVELETLMKFLPGADPAKMLRAYEHLDKERRSVIGAWVSVRDTPTLDNFIEHSVRCSAFFALVTSRVNSLPGDLTEGALCHAVRKAARMMEEVSQRTREIEEQLSAFKSPSEKGIMLGRELYNPYTPGLWGDPYFIPPRVGTLTPVRVRALLGESIK